MPTSEYTNIRLRLSRSPTWLKTVPPSGRAKKPPPNVANDSKTPDVGEALGKNNFGKTSAAMVP